MSCCCGVAAHAACSQCAHSKHINFSSKLITHPSYLQQGSLSLQYFWCFCSPTGARCYCLPGCRTNAAPSHHIRHFTTGRLQHCSTACCVRHSSAAAACSDHIRTAAASSDRLCTADSRLCTAAYVRSYCYHCRSAAAGIRSNRHCRHHCWLRHCCHCSQRVRHTNSWSVCSARSWYDRCVRHNCWRDIIPAAAGNTAAAGSVRKHCIPRSAAAAAGSWVLGCRHAAAGVRHYCSGRVRHHRWRNRRRLRHRSRWHDRLPAAGRRCSSSYPADVLYSLVH
jgi:hypothetical protein